MIREIYARTLLSHNKEPDPWFGIKCNMNLYRGCEHQCIYCDSRSECYQIENFSDVLVKVNAIDLLKKELANKRVRGTVGTGSMNDPYTKAEGKYNMTGKALKVIAQYRFSVHINTKSDLILKDLDTLVEINRIHASVCFTVTTTDDDLAKKLEPGAPSVLRRLKAARILADNGIHVGITMMPILPFIEDNEGNIANIVGSANECGAEFIIPCFGMTLRDRQRSYYYDKLDKMFPGMKFKYKRKFGDRYHCPANNAGELSRLFNDLCAQYGIATKVKQYEPEAYTQLSLI